MPKILFINSVCYGSTGGICKGLYDLAVENGFEACIAYGRGEAPKGYNTYKIGNKVNIYTHALQARLFDSSGFGSMQATNRFVEWIDTYKPDIVHLHNLHGYYLNVEIMFNYLKKHNEIKVVWTLHDCWSFTGHCPHFENEKCDQWKTGCTSCVRTNDYPKSFKDNCEENYHRKNNTFNGLNNMTIVTPCYWLKHLLKESFLKNYDVKVINNGIDLNVFKKIETSILDLYSLKNKRIILGVASVWDDKKGLDTFVRLSKEISNDYKIVLIGLNKRQINTLPNEILGIERTNTVDELVQWYNAAHVFFNPTLEDTYPTVNLEAQACGIPIVTYKVGGTQETVFTNKSFCINDYREFIDLLNKDVFVNKSWVGIDRDLLDKNKKMKEYIDLYKELLKDDK